jgi:hypothetical protein
MGLANALEEQNIHQDQIQDAKFGVHRARKRPTEGDARDVTASKGMALAIRVLEVYYGG